jgi:gliding motility associated protien GldN
MIAIKNFWCRVFTIFTLLYNIIYAQQGVFKPGDYRDGVYDKENSVNRRFIPYTYLREADVAFKKRIWRDIDLKDKLNLPLYYPVNYEASETRMSLLQILRKYILSGQIIAFDDEQFLVPLPISDVKCKMCSDDDDDDSLNISNSNNTPYDKNGNPVNDNTQPPPKNCDKCVDIESIFSYLRRYRLKEDWFFDKQRSVLDVRILGLQPIIYDRKKGDFAEFYKGLFWIYFPACRPIFAKHEVFNPKNPAESRTFDDIFWKRQFNSTIIKEENVYNRLIQHYLKGIDNLLEAERIKNDLFKWEHDLWHL